jgi:Tfp pilus assembly protein PilF
LYTPPPFPDSKFIEFEDEIVESKPSLVSDVNDIADKEEMFNFATTMPLVEPETLAGDQGINTELDNLIDDHVADFSTSITTDIPQLPIGTVDLTQPKIEFSENKTDTLLFGEDETELQEELPPLPQVIEKEIILHDEIMVSEEVSANFVSDEIPINIESDSEIDSVVSLYNQVLKQYPLDITKQYFHLKLVLREVDNDHQRLNYLLPFVENNPDHLEAKVAVSKIYQSLGKWEDAKSLLEEILLIHPNHGESIYELASLLISHFPDRMERAGNLLKQCLRQLNYPKEALYTYAIYLNSISNKPYKALEYYLKTIEALPNHKFAYYDIATFYFNEGEKKIAREFYLKSVQNNPELKIPDNDLAFDVHPS